METLNKNKEEIEKIGCGIRRFDGGDGKTIGVCGDNNYLCLICRKAREERIKTSILWCEDEIDYLTKFVNLCDYTCYSNGYLDPNLKIKKFQTYLNWLKEQEKEL